MSDTLIKVEGLYKKFCCSLKHSMLYGAHDIARSMFGIDYERGTLRRTEFWALQDINFELKRGETLGLIGKNGSGKTTLLRMLNGIFPPDKGVITISGRIGALIAVGAGFHPHLTGRENIYLNGTILGMTKKEINRKFDQIVDFAEIGSFIDAPVATYSSGMHIRLGFAIAIHADINILLVDEILAVGDLRFQQKCFAKIGEKVKEGVAIIFVSHDMFNIQRVCKTGVMLRQGAIIGHDAIKDMVSLYYKENKQSNTVISEKAKSKKVSSYNITYEYLKIYDDKGVEKNTFFEGETIIAEWKFKMDTPLSAVTLYFGLQSDQFTYNGYSTYQDNIEIKEINKSTIMKITLFDPFLSAGEYDVGIGIWDENFIGCYFWDYESTGKLKIINKRMMLSRFEFKHEWNIL